MREFFQDTIVPGFNFWIYVILMMIGLYAMIAKNNFVKKLIGMSIFQTAIILFYVSIGVKGAGTTIPILEDDLIHPPAAAAAESAEVAGHAAPGGDEDAEKTRHDNGHDSPGGHHAIEIDASKYANPLPHVLMLTAIVVGVATLGVGLALCQRLYAEYGTLEEDEILEKIKASDD